jgi:hypothetical protein
MLEPLTRSKSPRRRVSTVKNFGAPTSGWAVANDFMAVAPNTALILKNIVPRQNTAAVRAGSKTIASVTGRIESMYAFSGGVLDHLVVAASGKLYKVALPVGVTPAAVTEIGTGFANSVWSAVMMANAADKEMLVLVNGVNDIQVWDGTALIDVTTAPTTRVQTVTTFKNRLWFTETGTASLWYGEPLSNKPTTLTEFPIGALLRSGGSLVAVNSLTMDGGSGPDDYLVAVSSNGEIVVFSGIDPGSDMVLVGLFRGAKPLSNRCLKKSGSDLIYYGSSGPQLMSELFNAREGIEGQPIAIRTAFENAMHGQSFSFCWDFVSYPARSWVVFNIVDYFPTSMKQYALNLETNAWFEIEGWNGLAWSTCQDKLYFGTANGAIVQADVGLNDNGKAIQFDFMQSWNQFETASTKKFNQAQVTIKADAPPVIAVDIMLNYVQKTPKSQPGFSDSIITTPWNTAKWNASKWSGSEVFYLNSFGLAGVGAVGALRYRGQLIDSTHELYGFRILFEEGDVL